MIGTKSMHATTKSIAASVLWVLTASLVLADEITDYMQKGETAFNRADIVDALAWYRKAAEAGHAPAQVRLAQLLDYSEQNEAAVGWYRKAADQGYAPALYELGTMYAAGEGVPEDDAKAVELFSQAADHGHIQALRALATAYEQGGLKLDIDHARAVALLERGTELGDVASTRRLANAYSKGELGLAADPARAEELLARIGEKPGKERKK